MRRLLTIALAVSLAGCGASGPARPGQDVYLDGDSPDVHVWYAVPVEGEPRPESEIIPAGVRGLMLGEDRGYLRVKLDDGPVVWVFPQWVKPVPK